MTATANTIGSRLDKIDAMNRNGIVDMIVDNETFNDLKNLIRSISFDQLVSLYTHNEDVYEIINKAKAIVAVDDDMKSGKN